MSLGVKDKKLQIENFERSVLLARPKAEKNQELLKSKGVTGKVKKKKLSSEGRFDENLIADNANKSSLAKRKTKKSIVKSNVEAEQDETPPKTEILHEVKNDTKKTSRKKEKKLSDEGLGVKTDPQRSTSENKISPSCRAPKQKKRKCSNKSNESPSDITHVDELVGIISTGSNSKAIIDEAEVFTDQKPPDDIMSAYNTPPNTANSRAFDPELQMLARQIAVGSDSCTTSPVRTQLTYGASRYMKPVQTEPNNGRFNPGEPEFPPGLEYPKENKYDSHIELFREHSLKNHSEESLGQSPGFEEKPSYVADNRFDSTYPSSQHTTESEKPTMYTTYEHIRDKPKHCTSNTAMIDHRKFVGKHPSLTNRKSFSRPSIELPKNENKYFTDTDSDGEVNKICMQNQWFSQRISNHGGDKCSSDSEFQTPTSHILKEYTGPKDRSWNRVPTIPTFTELAQYQRPSAIPSFSQLNRFDNQFQTPTGPRSSSRVQDPRWSIGSASSQDSPGSHASRGSPSYGAARGSPSFRLGGSSSPGRNTFTGKPRSSNSSPVTREVRISKMLSGICRHKHGSENLMMLDGGYFSVEEIMNTHRFKQLGVTKTDVEEIVRNNDKQRFNLKEYDGNLLICANQGHSIEVRGLELEPILSAEEYSGVVHGTYEEAWGSIKVQGLSRMNRTHIHFALGMPSNRQVISGMRSDCQVAVYIDVEKAIQDGYKFFRSKNNVILCSGNEQGFLPTSYFKSVIRLKGNREVIHETRPPVTPAAEVSPSGVHLPNRSYTSANSTGKEGQSTNWRRTT